MFTLPDNMLLITKRIRKYELELIGEPSSAIGKHDRKDAAAPKIEDAALNSHIVLLARLRSNGRPPWRLATTSPDCLLRRD
jgi:hypothetical protein